MLLHVSVAYLKDKLSAAVVLQYYVFIVFRNMFVRFR